MHSTQTRISTVYNITALEDMELHDFSYSEPWYLVQAMTTVANVPAQE